MIKTNRTKTFCIVPAAGIGKRMGKEISKQYLLLEGKPVILHTLLALEKSEAIDAIYLVVGRDFDSVLSYEYLRQNGISKLAGIVAGGKERQESVYKGLTALPAEKGDMVIVHDGVRPFVTSEMIYNCLQEAKATGAAVVAVPITDTLNRVENGKIRGDIDRKICFRLQTPQCFSYELLLEAHEAARGESKNVSFTDDSGLIRKIGREVGVILGNEANIKLTTPFDLNFAHCILEERQKC